MARSGRAVCLRWPKFRSGTALRRQAPFRAGSERLRTVLWISTALSSRYAHVLTVTFGHRLPKIFSHLNQARPVEIGKGPREGPLTPRELIGPEAEASGNSGEPKGINATTRHGQSDLPCAPSNGGGDARSIREPTAIAPRTCFHTFSKSSRTTPSHVFLPNVARVSGKWEAPRLAENDC
jgi:hypothetical protein